MTWAAVAKPDLLGSFFRLFWGNHDLFTKLTQPQLPTNSLQCITMYPKCIVLFHFEQCKLVLFGCFAVHCSELLRSSEEIMTFWPYYLSFNPPIHCKYTARHPKFGVTFNSICWCILDALQFIAGNWWGFWGDNDVLTTITHLKPSTNSL